jgi:hypothetical protein
VRIHNAQTNKEKQNKMETMYQVHIKEGINAEVRNYDSLSNANRYVIEKASEMGLHYGYDADGWAFAHDGENTPCSTEIFIFQII